MLVAPTAGSDGAIPLAGVLLMPALGFGLYAYHWLSLAARSRVGARSEDEVRRALAPLQSEGWRLRHSLTWRGRGDIDSLAIAPTGAGFAYPRRKKSRAFGPASTTTSAATGWRDPQVARSGSLR